MINQDYAPTTFWQRQIPNLLILAVMLVLQAWPSIPYDVMPSIPLCLIFYWTVYRPDMMHPTGIFTLSVIQDAFAGYYIGVTALIWLVCYGATLSQRWFLTHKSFLTVWFGFSVLMSLVYATHWIVFYFEASRAIPVWPVVFSYLITVAIYPLVSRFMLLIHKAADV